MKNKVYKRVRKFALEKSMDGTLFASIILLLYRLFTSVIVDAIITILGTVVIAIMIGRGYYRWPFWICVFVYMILVVLMAWAKGYQKERLKEYRILKQALLGVDGTLRMWSDELHNHANAIMNLKIKTQSYIREEAEKIDFQHACFLVCNNIWTRLTKYYENENIYVTVFQKNKQFDKRTNEEKSTCRMIAYSGNTIPSSFNEVYKIPTYTDDLKGTVEYHSYLFSANNTNICVLPDRESVKKNFVIHQRCAEREEAIQQYIGIPIAPAGLDVTFILQVDTNIPNLFGKDKEEVTLLAQTAIYPFAQFLHMTYEELRMIAQIVGGGNL